MDAFGGIEMDGSFFAGDYFYGHEVLLFGKYLRAEISDLGRMPVTLRWCALQPCPTHEKRLVGLSPQAKSMGVQ
jgi:hypothetical protein